MGAAWVLAGDLANEELFFLRFGWRGRNEGTGEWREWELRVVNVDLGVLGIDAGGSGKAEKLIALSASPDALVSIEFTERWRCFGSFCFVRTLEDIEPPAFHDQKDRIEGQNEGKIKTVGWDGGPGYSKVKLLVMLASLISLPLRLIRLIAPYHTGISP